jgi:hypothetical protein
MIADPKTEVKLSEVIPDLANRWRKVRQEMWERTKLQIKVTEGYRSFAKQFEYYSQGRKHTKQGWEIVDAKKIISHALPGSSYHNYGLALDSAFCGSDPYLGQVPIAESKKLWDIYGELVQKHGMFWGGTWTGLKNDRPHCEVNYGYTTHSLQIMYEDVGIKGIWAKLTKKIKAES